MDETPRSGPFDSYSYSDELILDIQDVIAFMQHLGAEPLSAADLRQLSESQLEYEYRRVQLHLAMIFPASRKRAVVIRPASVSDVSGAHYSPHSGRHISERSG